jgi:hypothetical protein
MVGKSKDRKRTADRFFYYIFSVMSSVFNKYKYDNFTSRKNEKKMSVYVKTCCKMNLKVVGVILAVAMGNWRPFGKSQTNIGNLVSHVYRVVETFLGKDQIKVETSLVHFPPCI